MGWGGGGGRGGGRGGGAIQSSGDVLWDAVQAAVKPLAPLEQELDAAKLEKKLYDQFKKGAKSLNFKQGLEQSVDEYCVAVFSGIFSALGDRDWLAQADFLFCVDAGVKELFPSSTYQRIPTATFEQIILQAVDKTYDQQRYEAKRWETAASVIQGKKTQSKVRDALDQSRARAFAEVAQVSLGNGSLQAFLTSWILVFVQLLADSCEGDPRGVIEEDVAIELFDALCQEGSLPMVLVQTEGVPPPGWPLIGSLIWQAYGQFPPAGGWPRKGKGKGKAKSDGGGGGGGGGGGFKGKGKGKGKPAGRDGGKPSFTKWGSDDGAGDDVNSIPLAGIPDDELAELVGDIAGELSSPPAKRARGGKH